MNPIVTGRPSERTITLDSITEVMTSLTVNSLKMSPNMKTPVPHAQLLALIVIK